MKKCTCATKPISLTEEIESDPRPLFEAMGKEIDLERCRRAYLISHRHPRLLLRWLETWIRHLPDKPLPREIVDELPHLRDALDRLRPVTPSLNRKIRRELAFEHLEAIEQPVGSGVARDLATREIELDRAQDPQSTVGNARRHAVRWRQARSRRTGVRLFDVTLPQLSVLRIRRRK